MESPTEKYSEYVRPIAGEQMRLLGLDWVFTEGSGDWLKGTDRHGRTARVLDLLGGFGSTILGHAATEAVDLTRSFLAVRRPLQAQLSCRFETANASELLSEKLAGIFGEPSVCHWVSTGSECVEVALKHALLAHRAKLESLLRDQRGIADRVRAGRLVWNSASARDLSLDEILALQRSILELQPRTLSLTKSYHGRTLGALTVSDFALRESLGGGFATLAPNAIFVDPRELATAADALLAEHSEAWPALRCDREAARVEWISLSRIVAVIVEPLQGEGGILPLSRTDAERINALTANLGAHLVADEIQCGLGRTGAFLASDSIGLRPDVVLLGKGLGAGIAKTGVVAIRRGVYRKEMGRFGSTFGEDGLGSELAKLTIEHVSQEKFLKQVRATGDVFVEALAGLRRLFPDVIGDVRGRGMMIGVELVSWRSNPSNLLRLFDGNGLIGYLAASFLLNRHGVRVGPSLGAPQVLRIEPSGAFDVENIPKVCAALAELCLHLRHGDFASLTKHLWDPENEVSLSGSRDFREHARISPMHDGPVDAKVAFLGHLLRTEDLPLFDASLVGIPVALLADWYRDGEGYFRPALFDRAHLRTPNGKVIEVNLIGIYETPETIIQAHRAREADAVLHRIQQAVDQARTMGCSVVGLGGLISVVSRNGYSLDGGGMALTTGNSLTLAMSCQALERHVARAGLRSRDLTLAIVGAAGNIGRAYAAWGGERFKQLLLVGRPGRTRAVESLAESVRAEHAMVVRVSEDLSDLRDVDLVVSLSNSPFPLILPEHLSPRVRCILDVAAPMDVSPEVAECWPMIEIIRGGSVKVPGYEGIIGAGIDLPNGHTLACLAETVVLGLQGIKNHFSYGEIELEKVLAIADWARAEGFHLAPLPAPLDEGISRNQLPEARA